MGVMEVSLNTFALDCSSKPETIMRQLRTTADKREIEGLPKLPSETSFIRDTLYEMIDEILIGDRVLGTTTQSDIADYLPLCSYRKKLYS